MIEQLKISLFFAFTRFFTLANIASLVIVPDRVIHHAQAGTRQVDDLTYHAEQLLTID